MNIIINITIIVVMWARSASAKVAAICRRADRADLPVAENKRLIRFWGFLQRHLFRHWVISQLLQLMTEGENGPGHMIHSCSYTPYLSDGMIWVVDTLCNPGLL